MVAASASLPFICLAFNFTLCSIASYDVNTLSLVPVKQRRSVPSSELACPRDKWLTALSVIVSAVEEHYSMTRYHCNDQFCYLFPRVLNRFRRGFAGDPDSNPHGEAFRKTAQCAALKLRLGSSLHPLGAPLPNTTSILLGPPSLPHSLQPEDSLSLCYPVPLLPSPPFNHPLIAPPTLLDVEGKGKVKARLADMQHGVQDNVMTRQFSEVMINLCVQHVNSQKFDEAIKTVNMLTDEMGNSSAACICRGTALALSGRIMEAIEDYTQAITLDPKMMEGWRRRAQARAAIGDNDNAIKDFTKAISLARGDMELLMERGLVFHRSFRFSEAASDLRAVVLMDPKNTMALAVLGQSLIRSGQSAEAVTALRRATEAEPGKGQSQTWAALGEAYTGVGRAEEAQQAFTQALKLDGKNAAALRAWSTLHFKLGNLKSALELVDKSLSMEPDSIEGNYLKASCHHGLAELRAAAMVYERILSLGSPPAEQRMQFLAFYQRELASYTATYLRSPLPSFNLSRGFPPIFKQAWSLVSLPTELFPGYDPQPHRSLLSDTTALHQQDLKPASAIAASRQQLVEAAEEIGDKILPLFGSDLASRRMSRVVGLSAIEMMQAVQGTWMGGEGASEKGKQRGGRRGVYATEDEDDEEEEDEEVLGEGGVLTGWRQLFDISVRWQQLALPHEALLWADEMTPRFFSSGVSLSLPILSSNVLDPRFAASLDTVLALLRDEMLEQGAVLVGPLSSPHLLPLPLELDTEVEAADSASELWKAVGEDFCLVIPCFSQTQEGHILNGSTVCINYSGENRFDLSLHTTVQPLRWADYSHELEAAWRHLSAVMMATSEPRDVHRATLRLLYFWYNFAPLSTLDGTALTGHSALAALFSAAGLDLPHLSAASQRSSSSSFGGAAKVQWAALLSRTLDDFIGSLPAELQRPQEASSFSSLSDVPTLSRSFPTVLSAMLSLSLET